MISVRLRFVHKYAKTQCFRCKLVVMKNLFTTSIGGLRLLGFFEGMSWLILLFIAMPMKYFFDNPILVKHVGRWQGALFVLFVVYAVLVSFTKGWSFKVAIKLFLASIVPFGTFWADVKILKPLAEAEEA